MTKVFTCGIMFNIFDENLDHCLHKLKVKEYVIRNLSKSLLYHKKTYSFISKDILQRFEIYTWLNPIQFKEVDSQRMQY